MAHDEKSAADYIAKINTILHDSVTAGVPGISAAISSAQGKWTFTAGVSDLGSLEPVETTHLFGIGSISKMFTAVVIFQLIDEKRLQLSDSVSKILSLEVYDQIDDAKEATVEQLPGHLTGIDSWEDDPIWIRKGRGSEMDPAHDWGKTEPLDYIRRPKIKAPDPGQWYYANTNYTLLGLIVENITQNTAEAEIRRRILEPLNMDHIFLEGFEAPSQGLLPCRYHWATETFRDTAGVCPSFPEVRDDLIDCTTSNLSTEWTAGGIMSSASDLLKFATALRDGKLLSKESLAIMKDWTPASSYQMGHGLEKIKRPGDEAWLGHFGSVLGFTGALWWVEKGDCVIAVLSNVGTMHAGIVPSSIGKVILRSDFLTVASQLAASSLPSEHHFGQESHCLAAE